MSLPFKFVPFSPSPLDYEPIEALYGLLLVPLILFVGWAIVKLWKLCWRGYDQRHQERDGCNDQRE